MRSFARFLGIPDAMLPAGRTEFGRYFEDVIGGGALGTSEVSRRVARQVLWFRHWSVPAPVVRLERALALVTVDPRLLDALDLRPRPRTPPSAPGSMPPWSGTIGGFPTSRPSCLCCTWRSGAPASGCPGAWVGSDNCHVETATLKELPLRQVTAPPSAAKRAGIPL